MGKANGSAPRREPRRQSAQHAPIKLVAPSATAEEAAAIVAALERFTRATAPAPAASTPAPDPWWRSGVLEGAEREAPGELREPWMSA